MKKEKLLAIGLTEEQAKQVMMLRGEAFSALETERDTLKADKQKLEADLATQKTAYDDAANQLADAKQRLADVNKQLEANQEPPNFQTQLDELNKKLEASEQQRAEIEFDSRLKDALGIYKPKNASRLMQILDRGKIAAEDDELKGLEEQIKQLKESDGYLFEDEAPARGGRQIENGGDVGKFDMNQAIRQAAGK